MESSSIAKKTLPLIIVLLLIIGLAVSCTVVSNKRSKAPEITNGEAVYLEYQNLKIKNKDVYDVLKTQYGHGVVLDLIDRHLLSNVDGVDYLAKITDEEIAEEFKNRYGDLADVPEDELEKKTKAIYDQIFYVTGLRDKKEVDEAIRLDLARNAFTKDKIVEEYEKSLTEEPEEGKEKVEYFKEEDFKNALKDNYKSNVIAIAIPYNNSYEVKIALEQQGVRLNESNRAWVFIDKDENGNKIDGEELTLNEIIAVFINLYNSAFAHLNPNYPQETLVLKEGEHYNVVDGDIVFNHNEFSEDFILTLTGEKIKKLKLENLIYNTLKSIDESEDINKVFTYRYDTKYDNKNYLVLKVAQAEKNEFDTVLENGKTIREEILEGFIDKKNTSDKRNKELTQLRRDADLVIYDPFISMYYSFQDSEYKVTKKTSKDIVVKVDGLEITADELFKELSRRFAYTYTSEKLLYEYMFNSEFNDFYDFDKDKFLTKEDREKYNEEYNNIRLAAKSEYAQYYAAHLTLEEFLISSYNVRRIEDLKYKLFYRDMLKEYREDYADIEANWNTYLALMEADKDKFFSVTGVHFLINLEGEDGKMIHPDEWTDYQRDLASELVVLVKERLEKEVRGNVTHEKVLQNIQTKFEEAPMLVAGFDVDSPQAKPLYNPEFEIQEVDYTFSKFKSAGFKVVYQDLGIIVPGQMVVEFEEAVRFVWDTVDAGIGGRKHNDKQPFVYDEKDIVTEFGYHVFVATNTTDYKYADAENKTLPTKEQVIKFFDAKEKKELKDEVINAINTNFMPIYNERKGVANEDGQMNINHADIALLEVIKGLADKVVMPDADRDTLIYSVEARISAALDALIYKE